MKKIISTFAFLFLLTAPCYAIQSQSSYFGLSDGQTVKQYDKYGSYQGYYSQNGTQTKQYDKYGSYQGYYRPSGDNTVKHYDKYGSYQGYYRK